jgi:hypothetical protein
VPFLRPGIGEEDVNAIEARVRQARKHVAGVAVMQADVRDARILDAREALGDAVQERLDSEKARVRVRPRLRDQMLAGAEADFEDDFALPSPARGGGGGWGAIKTERAGAVCAFLCAPPHASRLRRDTLPRKGGGAREQNGEVDRAPFRRGKMWEQDLNELRLAR